LGYLEIDEGNIKVDLEEDGYETVDLIRLA
jgi:hypothetical protein